MCSQRASGSWQSPLVLMVLHSGGVYGSVPLSSPVMCFIWYSDLDSSKSGDSANILMMAS